MKSRKRKNVFLKYGGVKFSQITKKDLSHIQKNVGRERIGQNYSKRYHRGLWRKSTNLLSPFQGYL